MKIRLDRLVVENDLAPTREKAQALIMSGRVLVDGQKVTKSGTPINPESAVTLLGEPDRFVGRGGLKLEAAIAAFGIDLAGRICLDVGASTGGFTDCMLQHGAAKVYAIDVGTAQFDWKLGQDPRVILREKFNARYLQPSDLGEPVDFASMDVSFISATMILPQLPAVMKSPSGLVVLVKPQFEVGKGQVGKGGIVRDPKLHDQAIEKVTAGALAAGFTNPRSIPSPITGADGNREFLLYYLHA